MGTHFDLNLAFAAVEGSGAVERDVDKLLARAHAAETAFLVGEDRELASLDGDVENLADEDGSVGGQLPQAGLFLGVGLAVKVACFWRHQRVSGLSKKLVECRDAHR